MSKTRGVVTVKEGVNLAIDSIKWADKHLKGMLYYFRHLMYDVELSQEEVDEIKQWLADNPVNVEVVFSLVGVGFDKPAKWTMYIF